MTCRPYIVIGTGRSGSSTVARILHNKLGVFMGKEFRQPDENNPKGFWEDVEFAGPNWRLLNGKIFYPEWIEQIFSVVAERERSKIPWGFKDPDASHFLGLYLSFFENPKIIRCVRKKELVVASLMRCFGYDKEKANNIWFMKEMILDNLLSTRRYLNVYFDEERVKDEKITNKILEEWGNGQ